MKRRYLAIKQPFLGALNLRVGSHAHVVAATGRAMALLLLLLLAASPLAHAATPTPEGGFELKAPDPAKMGLALTESKAPDGRRVLTIQDTQTHYSLKSTYDELGRLATMEEYSPGGALLDRRSFDGKRFTQADFRDGFTFTEYERTGKIIRGVPEMRRVVYSRDKKGRAHVADDTFRPSGQMRDACIPEISASAASEVMRSFTPISASNAADTGEMNFSFGGTRGASFSVNEACDGYRNGRYQMASDFEEAVNIGLKCLGGRGAPGDLGPRARMDAGRLISFMQARSRGTVECLPESDSRVKGANARALNCNENDGVPGMQINLNNSQTRTVGNRVQTLFHEMLHWLGYLHYDGGNGGVDMPYLASICCFEQDARACDLLKKSDAGGCSLPTTSDGLPNCPANTGSVEFMASFARVLADSGRIEIAYTDAWTRSFRSGNVRWTDGKNYPDLSILMRTSLTSAPLANETTRYTLAYLAAGNVTRATPGGGREFVARSTAEAAIERAMDTSIPLTGDEADANRARRDFSRALGTLLSRSVNYGSGSSEYKASYKEFKRVRAQACPRIPREEQQEVSGTIKTLLLMRKVDTSWGFRCMADDLCNNSDLCLF